MLLKLPRCRYEPRCGPGGAGAAAPGRRGVDMTRCRGAGRSPADKRHGWRAFASAVGPALTELPKVAEPTSESPLLLCPEGQFLPAAGTVGDTPSRTGGGHDMKPHLSQLRIMPIM